MGSGEEKTKHSYYRVVYSAISLVQGVLLSEKSKRHSIDGKKGSDGSNTWTSGAHMGLPKGEEPQPILRPSQPAALIPVCTSCLAFSISLRLPRVSELGQEF